MVPRAKMKQHLLTWMALQQTSPGINYFSCIPEAQSGTTQQQLTERCLKNDPVMDFMKEPQTCTRDYQKGVANRNG